jgi:SAM-dependent methyltransferase
MGARPHYRCPWCSSSDKERLVYEYLTHCTDVFSGDVSVLHIAPEPGLMRLLRARPNGKYMAGDKFEGDARYTDGRYGDAVSMDVTDLSATDNTFDLILCNHVLEHVPNDTRAMSELFRVLKPGGVAVLQVPVSRTISKSIEDDSIVEESERIRMFGQADHVRIYAETEYLSRLRTAGFETQTVMSKEFLSSREIERLGVNPQEAIYVCMKGYT